jgi:hypothetical protein
MVATGAPRTQVTRQQRQKAASIYREYDRRREETRNLLSEKPPKERRSMALYHRAKRILMKNAFIPLFFRLFILLTSVTALALGVSILRRFIYLYPDRSNCRRGPTTYMAVVVGCVAVMYTSYIAWDEFSSKPLGLRRPSSKLKLLLLDLIFIIFMSANVSLAFEALESDSFPCGTSEQSCPFEPRICRRQRALVSVLMIAIVAWLSTFTVSLARLVFQVNTTGGTLP